ncbi:biotin-dependent carboxyltransferase family protein [Peribacillus saganii]|uniref:Biotin-dependent carboxyltransferase family protein n=1 Tax=Peribacillus saganii TaxID=2303992 RepID=A0A372LU20_9BACI|nr:biotin-dependent carboxyltransferase family protein [Peribacillus saganii]RFU71397.1 biotin-dependent carboxyltransferase family protein [Peribacillus saganii]
MLTIIKPGLLTTIQDLGRYGFQRYGVIVSGAMDQFAHRMANILVGNQENTPTMEITLLGPQIEFNENSLISICGGDLTPTIDGSPVRLWRSIFIKKGSKLKFGSPRSGCRAYLAVAGGISVEAVMASGSTYLRAAIGGYHGRALKEGDKIRVGMPGSLSTKIIESLSDSLSRQPFAEMDWSIAKDLILSTPTEPSVRIIRGREFNLFTKESREILYKEHFQVTPQSDRMGYRLKGLSLELQKAEEILSEAVTFGTIQVPSDGNPIILMADRQTTGGYPKIGQVAKVDLPLVAQVKPGDFIKFTEVSLYDAQLLLIKKEKKIQQLKSGISLKFR